MTAQEQSEEKQEATVSTASKMPPPVRFVSLYSMTADEYCNYVILNVHLNADNAQSVDYQMRKIFTALQSHVNLSAYFLTCFKLDHVHLEFHLRAKYRICLCKEACCHCGLVLHIQNFKAHSHSWGTFTVRVASEEDKETFDRLFHVESKLQEAKGNDGVASQPTLVQHFDREAVVKHVCETGNLPAHLSDQVFVDVFPQLLALNDDNKILELLKRWNLEYLHPLQSLLFVQTLHHNPNNAHAQVLKTLAPSYWTESFRNWFCQTMEFFNQKGLPHMTIQEASTSYELVTFWMFSNNFCNVKTRRKT
jgi:hypothetical protein